MAEIAHDISLLVQIFTALRKSLIANCKTSQLHDANYVTCHHNLCMNRRCAGAINAANTYLSTYFMLSPYIPPLKTVQSWKKTYEYGPLVDAAMMPLMLPFSHSLLWRPRPEFASFAFFFGRLHCEKVTSQSRGPQPKHRKCTLSGRSAAHACCSGPIIHSSARQLDCLSMSFLQSILLYKQRLPFSFMHIFKNPLHFKEIHTVF